MPHPRPKHLHRQVTRHGTTVWYVRRGHGPRVRIKARFGTAEFEAEYQAALAGAPKPIASRKEAPGSVAWLVARYRETSAWKELARLTRMNREGIYRQLIKGAGSEPIARVTKSVIVAGRDRRPPGSAINFVAAMRALFKWAHEAGHVKENPAAGVKQPKRKSEGFRTWTEAEMARYEARWPVGTRERVWLDVLAYTGLRRSDAVRLGRQHVNDGWISIRTGKTGAVVEVPMHPALVRTLDAGPGGDLTFITGVTGKPVSAMTFYLAFREACRAADVTGSPHGVRKRVATRAAEAGGSNRELEAMFGWTAGGWRRFILAPLIASALPKRACVRSSK